MMMMLMMMATKKSDENAIENAMVSQDRMIHALFKTQASSNSPVCSAHQ